MEVSFNLSIPNFFGINRTVRATVRFTIFEILILILRKKIKRHMFPGKMEILAQIRVQVVWKTRQNLLPGTVIG